MITDEQVHALIDSILGQPLKPFGCNDVSDVKSALEAYEQSKWISVEKMLPPRCGDGSCYSKAVFTICNKEHKNPIRLPTGYISAYNHRSKRWDGGIAVTHWHPIPEFKE